MRLIVPFGISSSLIAVEQILRRIVRRVADEWLPIDNEPRSR